jgi:hypothetical protein
MDPKIFIVLFSVLVLIELLEKWCTTNNLIFIEAP